MWVLHYRWAVCEMVTLMKQYLESPWLTGRWISPMDMVPEPFGPCHYSSCLRVPLPPCYPFDSQVLALEMLILMLESPSDDSVEMASDFTKEVGAHLQEVTPSGLHRWGMAPREESSGDG